jgi:hypothetical protein
MNRFISQGEVVNEGENFEKNKTIPLHISDSFSLYLIFLFSTIFKDF